MYIMTLIILLFSVCLFTNTFLTYAYSLITFLYKYENKTFIMPQGNMEHGKCDGKGNAGMFIDRYPKICAAGVPTPQPNDHVGDSLEHYLLKDEVDSLISDAIIPQQKPKPLPPLRHPIPLDMRHAGPNGEVAQLINPPVKTKFQTLVEDFKNTSYTSYWNKPLGGIKDPVPMLPEGLDIYATTFGKKTPYHGSLYDIIMPKEPLCDKTPKSKHPGVQINRKYCEPEFNPEVTFGYRTFVDKRGSYAKCCLTDDNIIKGVGDRSILNTIQTNYKNANQPQIGKVLAPYNNQSNVPEGHAFGKLYPSDNLPECLTFCELNENRLFFKKCLAHLNSLRKCLRTRVLPSFFRDFYLNLKFLDNNKTDWLAKDYVYKMCARKYIRFDPTLIEPLLSMWQAYNGSEIQYKFFVHILNYREPLPDIPKIPDLPDDCLDFRTTYTEMVRPNQEKDNRHMAGVPSGRYFDLDYPITPEGYCKADRVNLPQESDMKSCLSPSVLTLLHVNHRDMYAKREPDTIKKVFEAAGEIFDGNKFDDIWEEAKKSHSKGWVCYETFRRALDNYKK